ncbi:MAG: divergent polysaccharide deacetylase family protein [bacterium]|nr:divergent polysaccharide deacetylase family protein [bacterium]
MRGPRRRSKKKNSSLMLLVWFSIIAIVTITLLEYIDFKKGENSFIFTKIIPLENRDKKIGQFNKKLIALLKGSGIPYDYFRDEEKKYHFKLDIQQAGYGKLIKNLETITANLKGKIELGEIQGLADKSIMLYNVTLGKRLTHLLLISKYKPGSKVAKPGQKPSGKLTETPVETPVRKTSDRGPRIAFIIDDVGAYDIGPLEIKQLQIPVTASVLPDSRRARDVVRWAREYGLETMIHLPMQPTNSNGTTYDRSKTITLQSTDGEIRSLVRRAKAIVPQAKGLNNHQGSRVTSHSAVMTRVLKIIKQEGLFFIDSRTIGGTVAYDIAKRLKIRTTHKDVFIDHIQTYSHSISQIRKLVDIARQNGKAIAIGHPFESTLRAIRDSRKYIRSKGIRIVLAKELLE